VRRVDGASWNNNRLDFVTEAFQVSATFFENQTVAPSSEATHVFSDDPAGKRAFNNGKHRWPEVAVVCRSFSLSGRGEGLTWEAACEQMDRTWLKPFCITRPVSWSYHRWL
jgi:hypothetical protein